MWCGDTLMRNAGGSGYLGSSLARVMASGAKPVSSDWFV